jgi:hypothetical protein
MANSSVNLTSLDFDSIKSNLKTYLKSQSVFKDYDYDGSNMSVLLDVLSYNTYLNSFYLNMMASEAFLDTAQLRESVVSHAKSLNYTPYSMHSSEAVVNISFQTSGITTGILEMPKGTQFSGKNANGSYVFTTDETLTTVSGNSTFTFSNVTIYEGTYINENMLVDTSIENQKFKLSNPNIDTRSLVVSVYENNGANSADFIQKTTLYGLNSASNTYFLQSIDGEYYEILFGDGVFGRYPLNAATVLSTYRVTQGMDGDGVSSFNLINDIGAYNGGTAVPTITTVSSSINGSGREPIETIRFRAPRSYQTQERAVTVNDYMNLILDAFPDIKDVNIYGGEEISNSPQYGKIFISPTTYQGGPATEQIKIDIIDYLSNRKILNIINEIVDPEYIYIVPNIKATVNFNQTPMSPADVVKLISNTVVTYNTANLQKFRASFRLSKFSAAIDNTDTSILGNDTEFTIYKYFKPALAVPTSLSTSFMNTILAGTVHSTEFVSSDGKIYQITDYNPNISSFVRTSDQAEFAVTNVSPVLYLKEINETNSSNYTIVGTVDYDTGTISVNNLTVTNFLVGDSIKIFATTSVMDVYGKLNNVVEIDTSLMNITVVSA